MGSCASVHKSSESAMELKWSIESKTDDVSVESTTKNNNAVNTEFPVAEMGLKPQSSSVLPVASFRYLNSKEEMFFDSQPWLESDSEDFFSVNGDLTPSQGTTPVHQSCSSEILRLGKSPYADRTPNSISDPSPSDKKKKLVELFRENFDSDLVDDDQKLHDSGNIVAGGRPQARQTIMDLPPKSINGSPYTSVANSVCSSERTPNRGTKPEKEKLSRSVHCCLPSVVRSLSFSERKKRSSPPHSNEG